MTKRTVAATKLGEEDELLDIEVVTEHQHIILQSKDGYFLRFDTDEISRAQKDSSRRAGMRLGSNDYIEQVHYCQPSSDSTIPYKEKLVPINKLQKVNKRDLKSEPKLGIMKKSVHWEDLYESNRRKCTSSFIIKIAERGSIHGRQRTDQGNAV